MSTVVWHVWHFRTIMCTMLGTESYVSFSWKIPKIVVLCHLLSLTTCYFLLFLLFSFFPLPSSSLLFLCAPSLFLLKNTDIIGDLETLLHAQNYLEAMKGERKRRGAEESGEWRGEKRDRRRREGREREREARAEFLPILLLFLILLFRRCSCCHECFHCCGYQNNQSCMLRRSLFSLLRSSSPLLSSPLLASPHSLLAPTPFFFGIFLWIFLCCFPLQNAAMPPDGNTILHVVGGWLFRAVNVKKKDG